MSATGRYAGRTEQEIREELTFIGDRRDLIAHSVDIAPGQADANEAVLEDAQRVLQFVSDLASAIDAETEAQLATSEAGATSNDT